MLAAQAETANGRIGGVIHNRSTDEPVPGVLVSLASTGEAVLTDDTGAFEFKGVPPDINFLTFEAFGYRRLRLRVETPMNQPLHVYLTPVPIPLEPLAVEIGRIHTRLDNRLRAVMQASQVADTEELRTSGLFYPTAFLRIRMHVALFDCGGYSDCARVYGRTVRPRVFLNEMPLSGGLAELNSVTIPRLCRVEVIEHGTYILAYTCDFLERVARGEAAVWPSLVFTGLW